MVGQRLLLAVVLLALAGCARPPADGAEAGSAADDGTFQATAQLHDVAFTGLATLAGAPVDVSGMMWVPAAPSGTAMLLVHGFGGVKENYYRTLPQRGVDIGGRLAEGGRTVVAIDLPGYGASGGPRTGAPLEAGLGLEDYAFVIDQVADALRSGSFTMQGGAAQASGRVVGLGISMGGYLVDITQGRHGSFDAIVPVSASHRGLRSDAAVCFGQPIPPPGCADFTPPRDDFVLERADPEVVNATIGGYEAPHMVSLLSIAAWAGSCGNSLPVPACKPTPLDVNARSIAVPVLSVLASEDHLVDASRPDDEPASFPASPDARVMLLPGNGHMALHHVDHAEAVAGIAAWLDETAA